jgi:cytochrome b6-f complex iron-sulfur subunit
VGVSRRWLLSRGGALAAFVVAGCSKPLGPTTKAAGSGTFGDIVDVGGPTTVRQQITEERGAHFVPEGRFWLVAATDGELRALYQKCTHLGCRIPFCPTSGWFECPCHRSIFDDVGEYVSGPAPRGMDHFPVSEASGAVRVDTGSIQPGKPASDGPSTATPRGPHCVG